jgi:radical SAM superfamily enzyme YgiQ (UPF0313 family)
LTNDPEKQINVRMFNDSERIEKFIETKHDYELEREGEKILKLTNCKGFDIFGFSLHETTNPSPAGVALVLGKILKERYDSIIIVGGSLHEEVAENLLQTKFIDSVIYGESEQHKLLNFCQEFEKGTPLKKIPGITFVKNGKLTYNPFPNEKKEIFIKPDFDNLPLDLYKPKILCKIDGTEYKYSILILPYVFVHGCPIKCAFCPEALGGWIAKNPEEVARELNELSKKYRTKHFFFINTNINPTYDYANRLVDALIEHDINILWSDCASFCNMNKKLLRKLNDVGAVRLIWGMESGSLKVLKYVHKPIHSISYSEKILKEAYKLGIWNELDLICGFPYESEQDVNLTIKFILKNRKYIQEFHLSKFRPDGDIRMHPRRYGIRLRKITPALSRPAHAISFDEIRGLKWEEKVKQIDYYYQKIMGVIQSTRPRFETHKIPNMSDDELLYVHFINWWNKGPKIWDKKRKMFISNN